MLPFNCLTNTLYPMRADIYYATQTQDAFGTINKTWIFDRTVQCSAVSHHLDAGAALDPALMMKYKDDVDVRIPENIRIAVDTSEYPLTEILITNIRNENDTCIWNEYGEEFVGNPTVFEIKTVVPSLDPFQTIEHYYVYAARSQNQYADLEVAVES